MSNIPGARKMKALNLGIPAGKVEFMGLKRARILPCDTADDGACDGKNQRPARGLDFPGGQLYFTICNIWGLV